MPTLPLFDATSAAPGAWREVIAPGGWQWWQLDAIDDASGAVLCVTFHDGRWRDPAYQRRYSQFRKSPTQILPPRPADYRAFEIGWFSADSPAITELATAAPGDFEASSDEMNVRIGEYSLRPENDDFLILGPTCEVKMTPIGVDGSLWKIVGTVPQGGRFSGRGVLHSAFDAKPPGRSIAYRVLLQDRALIGAVIAESKAVSLPQQFVVNGMTLSTPVQLRTSGHLLRSTYSVDGNTDAVAIVEY